MIRHVVMWKLKEQAAGARAAENGAKLKEMIEALKPVIPEIVELEVGIALRPGVGEAAYDVALVSTFRDEAGLERYQNHPRHQAVVAFVREVTAARAAVDFAV